MATKEADISYCVLYITYTTTTKVCVKWNVNETWTLWNAKVKPKNRALERKVNFLQRRF